MEIDLEDGIDPLAYIHANEKAFKRTLSEKFFLKNSDIARQIYFRWIRKRNMKFRMSEIKRSLLFIADFCDQNDIAFRDYAYHTNRAGNRSFLRHIKNFGVSPWMIGYYPEIQKHIVSMEEDTRQLYFGKLRVGQIQLTEKHKKAISALEMAITSK